MAQRYSDERRSRRHRRRRHPFFTFLKAVLLLMMVAVLAAGGYAAYRVYPEFGRIQETVMETCSHMSEDDFRMVTDTEVYDKDGNKVGVINTGHYEYVAFDDISPWIKKAYIDQEDRRFYSHHGVDFVAMFRVLLVYLKNHRITQGGSTITQQVIKNTYLTQERTIERKLTEILIAPQLERRFSKDKILEFYCNGNFYAHGCYGVGAASRYYFGKSASGLEPWEAAVLVGISNRPSSYDPVKHPEESTKKRNEVLNSMYECGDLTKQELEEYQSMPLEIVQEREPDSPENYQTSYAIYCAALQLMKNDGFDFQYYFSTKSEYDAYQASYKEAFAEKSEAIRSGGYKIYTTLDSGIQEILQNQIDSTLDKRSDERAENGKYALQGAGVVVDNQTNSVAAVVGGRGTDDEYNRAFLSMRQPGSSIKPLLDYAPAFETGYFYPSYVIRDYKFEGGPENSGGKYYGYLPIREALNRSLNTVAWQLLDKIGISTGLSYLAEMDFTSLSWQDDTASAVSIGGFTYGTKVVEMAKGYSTLANGGVYSEQTCLTSLIYDRTGEELFRDNVQTTQVYTEGTAYLITDILKGTMDMPYGTGRGLDLDGQQAAGKTGTANDSKDTWFCGYTRYYTTAVWMGYDTPRAMPGIYGATVCGQIWHNVMTELHKDLPEKDWERPESVEECWVDYDTGARVDYNTGETDLFNNAVNPEAKSAYEQKNGTEAENSGAHRWREAEETSAAETESSEEESTEESISYEHVTGEYGGPGVLVPVTAPPKNTVEESAGALPSEATETSGERPAETIGAPGETESETAAPLPAETATVAPVPAAPEEAGPGA